MDRSSYMLYHKHKPDTRPLLEIYFSPDPDTVFKDDAMRGPMKKLHGAFSRGHMTGDTLVDISGSPSIHHLYSACKFFKEIILMRTNEQCIMEIMKWRDDHSGAFCWRHTTEHVVELEGKGDECGAKELQLKSAIKRVVKFDAETESLADLIGGQQADCVITTWLLDMICQDEEDYTRNLKNMIELLKPGGHLIIIGVTNASYYTLGEHKFHIFKYDENFVKKALVGEGMTVLQCEVTPRTSKSDLIDYNGVLFITACKQK